MSRRDPDKNADIDAASPAAMEPMLIAEGSRHRGALNDLAVELVARAAAFRRSLPDGVRASLADLVRAMNCYYSNLIEGHDTHPVDIERALRDELAANAEKRNLQLEARAHVEVQRWIDQGGVRAQAATVPAIRELHRRFCALLPPELLVAVDPESGERLRVEGGALRHRHVRVGQHVSISPEAVPTFLARFEEAYARLGRTDAIVAVAAAHHRLLWIHPFLDGNGRVARLMSHAMLVDALDTGGVWSIARALARRVVDYKAHLAACDLPRRNALDGRGALGEEALAAFTEFFLRACIDQVDFMEGLAQPDALRGRVLGWAADEARAGRLPVRAGAVLEALLYRGELPRGDVAGILGATERHGRRVVAALVAEGVLVSEGPRAPLRLAFPAALAARWMPGLFPEAPRGGNATVSRG